MPHRNKGLSSSVYVAIALLALIIIAVVAVVFAMMPTPVKAVVPGVKAGDTFTYAIRGSYTLYNETAVPPAGFDQNNATDYYKVTITNVNGSIVTMNTLWKFKNGTEIPSSTTIDLTTGSTGNTANKGFYFLYAPNLNRYDYLRPNTVMEDLIVNATDSKLYGNETRTRNIWTLENPFYDVTDTTYGTVCDDIVNVCFDKTTGMLDTLTHVQQFNNPEMTTVVVWQLVDSSVWQVK